MRELIVQPQCREKWNDPSPFVSTETDPTRLLSGVTILDIIKRLDSSYELVWLDRGSNFDDNLKPVQEAIRQGSMEPIYEEIDEWVTNAESKSAWEIAEQLTQECINYLWFGDWDIDEDYEQEAHIKEGASQVILHDYREWVMDAIYERNSSNPYEEMLSATSDQAMHYETDLYIGDWGYDYDEKVWAIKKHLGIKKKETKWDNEIGDMVQNAGYGGKLVFYFTGDLTQWVNGCNPDKIDPKKINAIMFKDPHIAIIDTMNGSGGDCQLKGFEIIVPFDRNNVTIDDCQHYNYTHAVCGMSNDWCDGTTVVLTHKRYRRKRKECDILNELVKG